MGRKSDLTSNVKRYATQDIGFDLVGIADANDPQFGRAPIWLAKVLFVDDASRSAL